MSFSVGAFSYLPLSFLLSNKMFTNTKGEKSSRKKSDEKGRNRDEAIATNVRVEGKPSFPFNSSPSKNIYFKLSERIVTAQKIKVNVVSFLNKYSRHLWIVVNNSTSVGTQKLEFGLHRDGEQTDGNQKKKRKITDRRSDWSSSSCVIMVIGRTGKRRVRDMNVRGRRKKKPSEGCCSSSVAIK